MKNFLLLLFFVSLFLRGNAIPFVNETEFDTETQWQQENCDTTVPAGFNNPQPPIVYYSFQENYTTVELSLDTGARCLDGTPYKYYFTRGKGDGINKWMVYFQGASFCGGDGEDVLESCYDRTLTQYGTSDSSYWGDNGTVTTVVAAFGWFSNMKEYNPFFADYNKVELISCDGANFQGSLDEPLYYNNSNGSYPLYIRGMNNTLATFNYLDELYGFYSGEEVIFGGGSIGGTAAIIWGNYAQDIFSENTRLILLSDAGLFVDIYSENNHCHLYKFFMQGLFRTLKLYEGAASTLYRRCRYSHSIKQEYWKCVIVEYIYDGINVPVFFFNTQQDFKQLTTLNGLGCILEGGLQYCNQTDRDEIVKVREKFLRVVFQMKLDKPYWGFWLRTCFEHTLHFTWAWYGHEMDVFSAETLESRNMREAFYAWYQGLNGTSTYAPSYIDVIDWLHNPLCRYGANQFDEAGLVTEPLPRDTEI